MDIKHIARAGLVVMAAVLLVTFAYSVAPAGVPAGVKAAFAQEAAPAAEATAATAAAPAESAEPKAEEGGAAEGEAKAGEKKEIPHVVGNPSPAQLQDLRYAWASIPGFDLLVVAIIGLVFTVGVIGFGVFKQMKV